MNLVQIRKVLPRKWTKMKFIIAIVAIVVASNQLVSAGESISP